MKNLEEKEKSGNDGNVVCMQHVGNSQENKIDNLYVFAFLKMPLLL